MEALSTAAKLFSLCSELDCDGAKNLVANASVSSLFQIDDDFSDDDEDEFLDDDDAHSGDDPITKVDATELALEKKALSGALCLNGHALERQGTPLYNYK